MKGNFTPHHSFLSLKSAIVCLLVAFFCMNSQAQNGVAVDFGDLANVDWKANAALDNSIAEEQDKITVALTAPNMQLDEKATFLAYQRLLNYIQNNLQAGKTPDEAIMLSYEQVVAEAPKDADLAHMPEGLLATFVPGLVEAFTEAPVPQAH